MAQLTLEMEDLDLQQLRAIARARQINPSRKTKAQLIHLLALQSDPKKYPARISGGAARAMSIRAQGGIGQIIQVVAALAASQALANTQTHNVVAIGRYARLRAGMLRAKQRGLGVAIPVQVRTAAIGDVATEQAERAKRLAAVMSMHGIWKDDPTKPQDGAEYQREVRAEWR